MYINKNFIINLLFFIIIALLVFVLFFILNVYASTTKYSSADNTNIINQELVVNTSETSDIINVTSSSTNSITNTISNTTVTPNVNLPFNTKQRTAKDGTKYTEIALLEIPSLNIKYPVLSSTTTELLKLSLNKYWGAEPNEVGNCCIIGHNYRNKKFFSKLPNIKVGNTFKITDSKNRTFEYVVYDTYYVDPSDTSCTSQLTNGKIEATLITCNSNGEKRFIVKARLK